MTVRTHLVERVAQALHDPAWRPTVRAAIEPGPASARGPMATATEPPAPPTAPLSTPVMVGIEALERAGLVSQSHTSLRTRLTEEIALVRQQVQRGIPTLPPGDKRCARVVMVTSARPNEGKTFTALNLAAAIAGGMDTPVLLVDLDERTGALADLLGLAGERGLRALAAGSCPPAALPLRTALPNLSVVTCGTGTAGPPKLPAEGLAAAVTHLAGAFPDHVIVLDMPPALATADAGALAPIVGQIVLVVRAAETQRDEIEAALDVIEACPEIRLLLNRTGRGANDGFGAYGGYDGHVSPPAP